MIELMELALHPRERIAGKSAAIAHDINNQLMLAMNHVETGNKAAARRALNGCSALTDKLLKFDRNEQPAFQAPPLEAIDLRRFVLDFLSTQPLDSSINLNIVLEPAKWPILADPTGLTRILQNLFSNAIAAMGGSGRLTVELLGDALWISDSGVGIAEDQLDFVFEPFYSSGKRNGTGLGLAVVRDLMNDFGGDVDVRSELGAFTTFRLVFQLDVR